MPLFLPPDALVSAPLPSTNVVKVLTWGQSNALGQGVTWSARTSVPYYIRALDEHLRPAGFFNRMGAWTRNQSVPTALVGALGSLVTKRGLVTKASADLVTAGRNPVFATVARSGTAISYFGSGQGGETAFDTYADELVAACGSSNWHIVTLHGESDAGNTGTASAYQANLTAWHAHMRSKFPSARIYAVQLNINLVATFRDTVRTAITTVIGADGNAEVLDCDAFGYVTPHYTDAGYDSIGALVATRVLANS